MRHILLDTNIVLDVLLDRAPWVNEARLIWQAVDDGHLVGYLAATSQAPGPRAFLLGDPGDAYGDGFS